MNTITQLIKSMGEQFDQSVNFGQFYRYVWNVDTAVGFGLNILGKIVVVGRTLLVPVTDETFGFNDGGAPNSFSGFDQFPFANYPSNTLTFTLTDDAYRIVILAKAFANIAATNAPTLNRLISNLFATRGRCYTVDMGNMRMAYAFEFSLSAVELAILTQSGVLVSPTGVAVSIFQSPQIMIGQAVSASSASGTLSP